MSDETRESIAASLRARAAEHRARSYWGHHKTADWLEELADEIRRGDL